MKSTTAIKTANVLFGCAFVFFGFEAFLALAFNDYETFFTTGTVALIFFLLLLYGLQSLLLCKVRERMQIVSTLLSTLLEQVNDCNRFVKMSGDVSDPEDEESLSAWGGDKGALL